MKSKVSLLTFSLFIFFSACHSNSEKGIASSPSEIEKQKFPDNFPPALSDLKNFPKEWVMLTDLAPDTAYSRNYVIMMEADSTWYGEVKIHYEDPEYIMTVRNYLSADEFDIKSCKRSEEAEMIYYNFDLVTHVNKIAKKLQVNFRENPDVPQGSVFYFSLEESDVFITRPRVKEFKIIPAPQD